MGQHRDELAPRSWRLTRPQARALGRHAAGTHHPAPARPETPRHAGQPSFDRGRAARAHRVETATAHEAGRLGIINEQVSASQARVAEFKDSFEKGLDVLIAAGAYPKRVARRLSHLRVLTMVVEGQDDDELGTNGSTKVSAYLNEHRRYIAAQNLDERDAMIHEGTHVLLSFGSGNIFDEPLAMQVQSDMSRVLGIQNMHGSSYGPHNRLFHGILQASGLRFGQVAGMAAGDDPRANFQQFQSAVKEGIGWNAAGIAQSLYSSEIRRLLNNDIAGATLHQKVAAVYQAGAFVEAELMPQLGLAPAQHVA